jgi:endonuclease YncB( thermonuclease family)
MRRAACRRARCVSIPLIFVITFLVACPLLGFAAEPVSGPTSPALAGPANSANTSLPGKASVPPPSPPDAPSPPPAGGAPAVEEWLNQTVRLHDTVQAVDRPSSDGKPSGEIRAGAEVKAIGLVANKRWVEIELPNQLLAYVPREAIEFENSTAAPAAPAAQETPTPATTASPAITRPVAATPAAVTSLPGAIRGAVTRVPNAATLVVADQRIRLSGIDPGPLEVLAPFESWVRGQGDLQCEPDAQTGRYRCFTSGGVDVAEAAILNGAGRVGDGAIAEYRDSETQARKGNRGLWGQP